MPLPPDAVLIDEQQETPQQKPSGLPEDAVAVEETTQEKPTVSQALGADQSPAASTVAQVVAEPLVELARGYNESAASMYGLAAGATSLLQKATANAINTEGLTKFLQNSEQQLREEADRLPKSELWLNNAFNLVGQSPAIAAQFQLIPLRGVTSLISKSAIIDGLTEFSKDQDFSDLASGAVRGATYGAGAEVGLRAGAKIIDKGVDILNKFGVKPFRAWIATTTGNEKLADDFIKDPNKFMKVDKRSPEDITREYDEKLFQLKEAARVRQTGRDEIYRVKKQELADKQELAERQMKEANLLAKDARYLETEEGKRLFQQKTEEAITSKKQAIDAQMEDVYSSFIDKARTIDEGLGEQVGMLKEKLIKQSKGVFVSWDDYGKPLEQAIKSFPEMKLVNGKLIPIDRTPAKEALANKLNGVLNSLSDFRSEGMVPLEYAYALSRKTGSARELRAFAAENGLLGDYGKQIDNILDKTSLKNLKIDGVELLVKSKEAKKTLTDLVEANKAFYEMRNKYDVAMRNYSFTDPVTGKLIPDPRRAINAIKNNDVKVLKQMEEGDRLLPVEDRVLPKMRKLSSDIDAYEKSQKELLDKNLSILRDEKIKFERNLARQSYELKKIHQNERSELQAQIARSADNIQRTHRQALHKLEGKMKDERDVILGSKVLDGWAAKQFGGVQAGLGVGALYTDKKAPLLLAGLLAPKTAKYATLGAKAIKRGAGRAAEASGVRELVTEQNLKAIRQLIGIDR